MAKQHHNISPHSTMQVAISHPPRMHLYWHHELSRLRSPLLQASLGVLCCLHQWDEPNGCGGGSLLHEKAHVFNTLQ